MLDPMTEESQRDHHCGLQHWFEQTNAEESPQGHHRKAVHWFRMSGFFRAVQERNVQVNY